MSDHEIAQPDYGTGQKKLGIYTFGFVLCSILTLLAFFTVMSGAYSKTFTFVMIYSAACLQFVVQLIYFLRLNVQTKQGQTNVMSFIFTLVILTSIVLGSLWIMWNLNYNMIH